MSYSDVNTQSYINLLIYSAFTISKILAWIGSSTNLFLSIFIRSKYNCDKFPLKFWYSFLVNIAFNLLNDLFCFYVDNQQIEGMLLVVIYYPFIPDWIKSPQAQILFSFQMYNGDTEPNPKYYLEDCFNIV